ncbi:MAG: hypothetical protein M1816_006528 [Peltula sp. TS41687]|nr:MAG: hypothetical protein M1816_006528 [Peltula sp. TS41687]
MSDLGRKDVTDQVKDKVTPDSSKSTTEKLSDNVSGATDKVTGALQPESEKSTTQKLSDSTRGSADSAQNKGGSAVDSVKDTVSNLAQGASDKAQQAANAVTGNTDTTGTKHTT